MVEYKYDKEADAVYISLRNLPYSYGKDLDDERRIDYASDNQPIGVELLSLRRGVNVHGLPNEQEIIDVLDEHKIPIYRLELIPYDYSVPRTGTYDYSITMMGTSNIAFNIQLGSETTEGTGEHERGIIRELTGVS